jgi:chromate reductase, NAD(P)H dehydrogenase (quinone)
LKNAIDWASRPTNVWADKAAAMAGAGGGAGTARSQYHLRQVGVFVDLHFLNKPECFVRAFEPPVKFNADGDLVDDATRQQLGALTTALVAWTRRLQAK